MKNISELETGTRQLLAHIHGKVGILTLNRPEAKNALSDDLTPALRKKIAELNDDNRVTSMIITGSGDAFCAGGDVKSMNSSKNDKGWTEEKTEAETIKDLQKKQITLTSALYNFNKPTIAVLPGAAAGAGLSIALSCVLSIIFAESIIIWPLSKINPIFFFFLGIVFFSNCSKIERDIYKN